MVYSNELFEENINMDQHIMNMQFHDDFCDLVSNNLLECEENVAYVQSKLWSTDIANEEKSNFTFLSYLDAQGELPSDSFNLLNEVEYQAFVFPVEGVHDSISDDQFPLDINSYDNTDSFFYSDQDEEINVDLYMHCEDDDNSFFFPNKVIESADVLGKTKEKDNFILPQENVNENQVYDRGKEF